MKTELEQKYYDLAVDFVKNHRKYDTCSDFLDEIVDDVMNRSMSIIENVNDESVISSYIQKMVSNSIITISKKHNVSTRVKKDFENYKTEIKIAEEPSKMPEAEKSTVVTPEVKEEMNLVENNDEILITDVTTKNTQELELQEDSLDIIENLDIDNVDSIEVIETETPEADDLLEQEVSDVVIETPEESEEPQIKEEIPEENETIGELEEIDESVTLEEEPSNMAENEPSNEFHQNYVDDMINGMNTLSQDLPQETIDLNETLELDNEVEESLSENMNQEDMLTEAAENEEALSLVDIDADSILPEENILEESGLPDENLMQYDDIELTLEQGDGQLLQEGKTEEINLLNENREVSEENVLNKLYEKFSYTPDTDKMHENIEDKENELKILSDEDMNILYLKYKKNLSINEIAAQTEKDVSEVIDILNTAIDLIKD